MSELLRGAAGVSLGAAKRAVSLMPVAVQRNLEEHTASVLNEGLSMLDTKLRVQTPAEVSSKYQTYQTYNGSPSSLVGTREAVLARLEELTDEKAQLEARLHELPAETSEEKNHEEDAGEEEDAPSGLARRLKKWYIVESVPELPYRMLTQFTLYPQWMPWCTDARVLERDSNGNETVVEVSFGIRDTLFGSVGDSVRYNVETSRDGHTLRVKAENNGFRFGSRLVYDWHLTLIRPGVTRVELNLEFEARQMWYLAVWDAIRAKIIGGMANAFRERLTALKAAAAMEAENAQDVSADFKGSSVMDVLKGPFLEEGLAVIITEANGKTIRHANKGFLELTGYSYEEVHTGRQTIKALLQGEETEMGVTMALGQAVQERLPASARVVNYRKDGSAFLNYLRFEPVLDNERDTGIVYWAVLRDIVDAGLTLESVKGPQGQRLLSQKGDINRLQLRHKPWIADY